jgi:hypothetical protein
MSCLFDGTKRRKKKEEVTELFMKIGEQATAQES